MGSLGSCPLRKALAAGDARVHFGIPRDTSLVMALLTIHDSILREALLARNTS